MKKFLVVVTTLADLRREPAEPWHNHLHDDTLETQLLYNEFLFLKGEGAGWYYVEAPEQQEFTHYHQWEGYPGWVRAECVRPLPLAPHYHVVVRQKVVPLLSSPSESAKPLITLQAGTRLTTTGPGSKGRGTRFEVRGSRIEERTKSQGQDRGIEEQEIESDIQGTGDREGEPPYIQVELAGGGYGWVSRDAVRSLEECPDETATRQGVIATAHLFLGAPYLWGGRGVRGMDCSGLINLAFRVMDIDIPRNAHAQWLKAKRISHQDLKPGDLIFVSAQGQADSITHVMLSTGGDEFIEASHTTGRVKTRTFTERFGATCEDLEKQGFIADSRHIFFGRIIQ